MLLAQVESFLEVVRTGSLTRAAETLFVSQPTLTERLHTLEAELGKPLFARTQRHGLQLTVAGEAFLEHAERIVHAAHEGAAAVAQAGQQRGVGVVFAIAPVVGTAVLARALAALQREHGEAEIQVIRADADRVIEMVLAGDADLGLGRAIRHPRLELSPVYTDLVVPVVGPRHRLAGVSVHASELTRERSVTVPQAVTIDQLNRVLGRPRSSDFPPLTEMNDVDLTKALAVRGAMIAFLPLGSVLDEIANGTLVRVRVEDLPPMKLSVSTYERVGIPVPPDPVIRFTVHMRSIGERITLESGDSATTSPLAIDDVAPTARHEGRYERPHVARHHR